MGSSLKRRSLVSALLASALVFGALALLSFATWAGRGDAALRQSNDPALIGEMEFAKKLWKPTGFERKPGLSPLQGIAQTWDVPSDKRRHMIDTALGFVDPGRAAELRSKAPALAGTQGRKLGAGKRGEIAAGFSAIQISEAALRSRSLDDIAAELKGMGVKVHDVMESRALLIEVPEGAEDAVGRADFVEAGMAWGPMFRVDPQLGRTPLIQGSRAKKDDLDIIVVFFAGTTADEARREIEAVAGPKSAVEFSVDGLSYETTLHYSKIAHLAGQKRVRYIYERPEYMLMNVETPTTAMVGNVKENLPFQKPYQDVGVDGGGIDTNADGQRVNNGTDTVPPQIVTVTDNGISADSVQFAQTAALVSDIIHPMPSPVHRKVHAIENVSGDAGAGCDGVLSGSGTHGNVVAGTIAGDGTSVGARITKSTVNIRPKYENLEMDGVARGARIILQDVGTSAQCTTNEILERGGNVSPGSLLTRLQHSICPKSGGTGACAGIVGGDTDVHLHVMPFGTPNFDLLLQNPSDGTYPQEARDIDLFLVNNRDYMVFAPVGHQGTNLIQRWFSNFNGQQRNQYPDLFDGSSGDNDPNIPHPLQVSPPATAKNLISVGGHFQDVQTQFSSNLEENVLNYSSKGPATAGSLRTAPLIMGVASDVTGFFNSPNTISAAVWRSRDNDNAAPVDAILDDANFGTSFAAAEVTGVAALIRDYFAQGFYPTGARVTADRTPNVSGSLVKASVVASANFLEFLETEYPTTNDSTVAFTRAFNIGTVGGVAVGVIGNNEQGYGRPVLTSVLPLANWPKGKGIGSPNTIEYPSAGLIIYDEIATGEPAINNGTRTLIEHTFNVNSDSKRPVGSTTVVDRGQMRIAVAWADPPSAAGSAGALVNDLDLEVVSPGPDGILGNTDDVTYDGNSYMSGGVKLGQWSLGRAGGTPDVSDRRNPVEAVHLSADPNGDGNPADSQLVVGTWRVRVKRGAGGATAGQITVLTQAVEDANGNGRLDLGPPSEDLDADGFLDADGQPYGLVIAGPVQGLGTQTIAGTTRTFPSSTATLDKSLYGCADQVTATIFEPDAVTAGAVTAASVFEVTDKNGIVVDSESGFAFTGSGSTFSSVPSPVRDGKPAVRNNGILETNGVLAEEPYFVRVRYADTPREASASARISCAPNLLAWRFLIENQDATQQVFIGGGCDGDQFLDSGENLTYSITFLNSNRDQDFSDVSATLSASGPGAAAIRVLNSPQSIGRMPAGQIAGVTFAIRVDAASLAAITVPNRVVDMTVSLQATSGQVQLSRQSYTFRHALNSDYETFHYSTDSPAGGRQIRDFNRNLQVDRPDITDPFLGIVNPDEDVTFSTMFIAGTSGGLVTNTLGEDLNNNGILDAGELDIIPNGILDKGFLLSSTGPTGGAAGDRVPWSFDLNSGGWSGFRHPTSRPALTTRALTWEYVTTGVCGFQSAIADSNPANLFQNNGAGIWHTGDGDPATPGTGSVCDNHLVASDTATPPGAEYIEDFLVSPIIAKVHQTADSRGLQYSAEFQRLGFNLNIQTLDDLTGGNFNVDNNVEDDTGACLMCQEFDLSYGGIDYQVGMFKPSGGQGFDPTQTNETRTFGPTTDPNGSLSGGNKQVTGDETGFTAFTQNSNPNSTTPIPVAPADLIPYPVPTAPVVIAPDGTPWTNDVAGPVRNVDFTLVGYAGGFVFSVTGQGGPSGAVTPFNVNPGVRWQIGIGFFTVESALTTGDYGMGIDDVVFEWDERHPVDEGAFVPAHTPACSRFGGAGQPAGQQCATLSVDRSVLYTCNDALTVTVNDPKRAGAGSVQVLAASNSDARLFSTGVVTALHPHETFTLPEVPAGSGIFTAKITVSQTLNEQGLLFVSTSDTSLVFYYLDSLCDANGNGVVGQTDFDNLDGDGIAFSVDNCPFDYNPLQEDGVCTAGTNVSRPCRVTADCGTGGACLVDGDGIGSICDNCPGNANLEQTDSDGDQVGDVCDLDDVDFDGIVNQLDNCKDVYNKFQVAGQGGRGAACDANSDRDGDGINDRADNCVRTPNATQTDSDADGIGNVCDGDCAGAAAVTLASGSCGRSNAVICTTDSQCPLSGVCQQDPNKVCTTSGGGCTCVRTCSVTGGPCTTTCPGGASDICGGDSCKKQSVSNAGTCAFKNDDTDVDGVTDDIDDCPVTPNPAIIPGTNRQADQDNDGIGDACDSPFMVDGDNNGIPDDTISFALLANCGRVALPNIVVESSVVNDVNGDLDPFCDAGEKCQMTVAVRNTGPFPLTDVTIFLATDDPDIQCVSRPSIVIGSMPVGVTIDTANIGGQRRFFEYTVSSTTQTTTLSQAKADFLLSLTSREALGTARKVSIQTLLDVDLPTGVTVTPVPGRPTHVPPIPDGTLFEDFDTDTDGNLRVDLSDGRDGQLNDTFGYTVGTAQGGLNALAGVGCFGYPVPPADNNCSIDSDNDMDWHIHCPAGECDAPHVVGSATNQFVTPPDGVMSLSGRNSLHYGRHVDATRRLSDTTAFRALAAFTTKPVNLTPLPLTGDLQLSFYHIADFNDNAQSNVHAGQAQDYGDVQIRLDRNPDATPGTGDDWGPWDKLVPFENAYDHTPYVWSFYGNVFYCNLTPTDTGSAPPAPRGVHETMCYPLGVWSHCGNAWSTSSTYGCAGPGVQGSMAPPSGALWVNTRFNLGVYLGARVQIRWIAQGWEFDNTGPSQDYQTYGCASGTCWNDSINDDGWWVDDIRITGAITAQISPVPDPKTPPASTCPGTPAGRCDPTPADKGLNVVLTVEDANHNGIYEKGEDVLFSAAGTTNPGGCVDGEVQYRVVKNGVVIHDYSADPTFQDSPASDATYQVLARCSSNPACTTLTGATAALKVYTGDGADIALTVTHDRVSGTTTLNWTSRPQPATMAGYDVFRGSGTDDGSSTTANPPDSGLATLTPMQCNMAQVTPIGSAMSTTSTLAPPINGMIYYLVGHRSLTPGAKTALGRGVSNNTRVAPIVCP